MGFTGGGGGNLGTSIELAELGVISKGSFITSNGSANRELVTSSDDLAIVADSSQSNGVKWGVLPVAGGGTGASSVSGVQSMLSLGSHAYKNFVALAEITSGTSAQLATIISDETGTGLLVFATSPTLTTPVLGAATCTTLNAMTITSSTGTFTLTAGKTFSVSNTLTLAGTDGTTMTFPTTSATIARTDAANTFTGVQSMASPDVTTSLTTPSTTFALVNATATTVSAFGAAATLNIGASATCILNFGGSTTASEFRFLEPSGSGTDYSAFKAVAQAASITYSLPPAVGAAGTFLTDAAGNGVLTWAAAGGGIPVPAFIYSTTFESSTRFGAPVVNSGTVTFGTQGVVIDTGGTFASSARVSCSLRGNDPNTSLPFANNPAFSTTVSMNVLPAVNDPDGFVGVGAITSPGTGIELQPAHFGFYWIREAGTWNLYGSTSDGTTSSLTAVLTTIVDNDFLELSAVYTSGSSVSFYYAVNGAARSSATTKATNLPAASTVQGSLNFAVTNNSQTTTMTVAVSSASYIR
mgnify:CR=1 FL=1